MLNFTATAMQLAKLADCGILTFKSLSGLPKSATMAIATPWNTQAISSRGDTFDIWKDGDLFKMTEAR